MNVPNRRTLVTGGVAVLLAGAVVGVWLAQHRHERTGQLPGWTDPQQPPDGVAGEVTQLTADQTWAANRCGPMTACCSSNTAGSRVRRTYASSLTDSADSIVRAAFSVDGGIG